MTGADEETPLLAETQQIPEDRQKSQSSTPLPWAQFSIILFLQLAEPLTSQVIYPFTPELIRSLHVAKSETEVGYYVGLMQSLFFATQAVTVLHWSRLSDHIGRKPVILTGLFGLSLSMYCFGLSRSFLGLVMSRALNGALNGNVGVMKSIMAEITDETNLPVAYAYMPIAWSTGGAIGPVIGGALSRPTERFPSLFGNSQFLKDYPYFLPCAIPATFTIIAWLVTYKFLKETVASPVSLRHLLGLDRKPADSSMHVAVAQLDDSERSLPFRKLFIPPVLIASGNYAVLAIVDIAYRAIQPLFFSTPIELGGLGLDPPVIGAILSCLGVLNGVFQVFFFAKLTKRIGSKNVFILGITSAIPCFALFPIMNFLARKHGLGLAVWSAVGVQIAFSVLIGSSYGAIFIFIVASSPNKASLGATNGLAQLLTSIVRAVAPAVANSLFSLSIDQKYHYLNMGLVYWVAIAFNFIAIWFGMLLPRKVWKDKA